jgi:hypothetical protein
MKNIVIGFGQAGSNVVRALNADTALNSDVNYYAIDSILNSIKLSDVSDIKYIPIISDEKSGSGRDRTRGAEMYTFHESQGHMDELYEDCKNSKMPIIAITSAAGGTGSGSIVPFCKKMMALDLQVIPFIICPNKDDPTAYHLNTNDLFIELADAGILTYDIFENRKGDADYTVVNNDIISAIKIILGKKYHPTDLDSIDDSDLDVILGTPGRFIAVSASASDAENLKKNITRKVLSGFQPAWEPSDVRSNTIMTAYSLTSPFADTDFKSVFSDIDTRIPSNGVFDQYRNIAIYDNDGVMEATIIVAGLPRNKIKMVDTEYNEASRMDNDLKRSIRPKFINKKRAVVSDSTDASGNAIKKFSWKK